jgi:hypothetical protein
MGAVKLVRGESAYRTRFVKPVSMSADGFAGGTVLVVLRESSKDARADK